MGVVIDFPVRKAASSPRGKARKGRAAQVVILPVIRIDRYDEQPVFLTPSPDTGRRRRGRSARA
jgi:hypothetical protein